MRHAGNLTIYISVCVCVCPPPFLGVCAFPTKTRAGGSWTHGWHGPTKTHPCRRDTRPDQSGVPASNTLTPMVRPAAVLLDSMVVLHDTYPKPTVLPHLQPVTAALCRQVNRLFNNSVALTASPFVSLIDFTVDYG